MNRFSSFFVAILFFFNEFASAEIPLKVDWKEIPSTIPASELKPGDTLKISVKVKNPQSIENEGFYDYGSARADLKWNEKTERMEGELVIPKYNKSAAPDSQIAFFTSAKFISVAGLTPSNLVLAKANSSEGGLDKLYFNPPQIADSAVDEDLPTISNVQFIKVSPTRLRVEFDLQDVSGNYATYVIIKSKWEEDAKRGIKEGQRYLALPIAGCTGNPPNEKCVIETDLPETIAGIPDAAIHVWDNAGNRGEYSSVEGGFIFDWKSRPITPADLEEIVVKDAELVEQVGRKVTLKLTTEGTEPVEIHPGVSNGSGGQSYGTEFEPKLLELEKGKYQYEFHLPKHPKEYYNNPKFMLFIEAANGTNSTYYLPEKIDSVIDRSVIKEVEEKDLVEIESIEFSKK